jgi:hypothetical protein
MDSAQTPPMATTFLLPEDTTPDAFASRDGAPQTRPAQPLRVRRSPDRDEPRFGDMRNERSWLRVKDLAYPR